MFFKGPAPSYAQKIVIFFECSQTYEIMLARLSKTPPGRLKILLRRKRMVRNPKDDTNTDIDDFVMSISGVFPQ